MWIELVNDVSNDGQEFSISKPVQFVTLAGEKLALRSLLFVQPQLSP